ncbi:MAG: class I SAM-dependent methyltransferase [Armatimonadota bacterium]
MKSFKLERTTTPGTVTVRTIREFWDSKAKENPYWFVSSYGPYQGERDLDSFWRSGQMIWDDLKRVTGYRPRSADTVVEIGCGIGRCTHAIASEVGFVEALDISEQMLALARRNSPSNVRYHLANGFDLRPIADAAADFVLAYCVFQHLPTLAALGSYLVEMVRVAKPQGLIAFTLTPRSWTVYLLPLLRARAWLRERLVPGGPTGLWRKAWVGIRPSVKDVYRLSPIELTMQMLHGDKWLFYGRRPC